MELKTDLEDMQKKAREIRGSILPKSITPEMVGGSIEQLANALVEAIDYINENEEQWKSSGECAQGLGDNSDIPMSQKAITAEIIRERWSRMQLAPQDNYLNPDSPGVIKDSYLFSDGTFRDNGNYYVSDYIPLDKDETLYVRDSGASAATSIGYYDSEFNFIAAISGNSTEVPGIEGCSYIRLTIRYGLKSFAAKVADAEYSAFSEDAKLLHTLREETEKCTKQRVYFIRTDNHEEEINPRTYSGGMEYLGNTNYSGWGVMFAEEYSMISFNAVRLVALGQAKNIRLVVGYVSVPGDGSNPILSDMVTLVNKDFTELNNLHSGEEITIIFDKVDVPQGALLYIGYESDTLGLGSPVTAYTGVESYRIYKNLHGEFGVGVNTSSVENYAYFYAVPLIVHAKKVTGPYIPENLIYTDLLADGAVSDSKIKELAISTGKLASKSVTNEKIADRSINIDKLAIAESRNIFNPDDEDVVEGKFLSPSTGIPTGVNQTYTTTGYMELPEGAAGKYAVASVNGVAISSRFIGFYDSEKQMISVLENAKNPLIPDGTVYIRTSFSQNNTSPLSERGYMLEVSDVNCTKTSYSPYRKIIRSEYLPTPKSEFVNEIVMPSKLYMLAGVQNDMYIDTFIRSWRPYMEYVRMAASTGLSFSRTWQRVYSITSPVDNGALTIRMKDYSTADVLSEITTQICSAIPSEGDEEVVVQVIGDSYTNGGWFVNALITQGFVPGVKCVGLRAISGLSEQYDEGRGGWTLHDYMSVPNDNSSRSYNGFMHPVGDSCYYGSTEFWKNAWKVKRGTAGAGFEPTYSCGRFDRCLNLFDETTGLLSNPKEGDVQKDSSTNGFIMWNGTSWVAANNLQWEFNYGKYLSMWDIEPPKFLAIMLGVNDFINKARPISFNEWNSEMQTLIESYHTAVPDGFFIICTPTTSFGTLDNSSNADVVSQHLNMWLARKNIIDTFDGREDDGIYIVDTALMCDSVTGDNGMLKDMAHPLCSPQNDVKVFEQSGLPHIYVSYKSMGIPLAAFIQKYR